MNRDTNTPINIQRRHYFLLSCSAVAALIFPLLSSSCKTRKKESDVVSATVNPSDPSSVAPGGANPNSSPAYRGTTGSAQASAGGVTKTYSGLKYEILRAGTGQRPKSFNKVKVHYKGTLLNGKVFDSSYQRGQPSTFGLTQVIPGWTEGLALMKEGAKYRFTIPPHLAYGAAGQPPSIGPNATLIFDVELIQVLY